MRRTCSGSWRSPSVVEPCTSQKRTVTVLRTSSGMSAEGASGLPQAAQNLAASGLGSPHRAQTGMAGVYGGSGRLLAWRADGTRPPADVRIVALAVGAGTIALAASAAAPPRFAGCPVFPADNHWNQRVDKLPVAANSRALVDSIGAGTGLHADFGSGLWNGAPIGIPITVVRGRVRMSRVSFDYADESDRGPYPITADVRIEGGGDRHALIVDSPTCTLYELYALRRAGHGWHAGSGAIWSLRSNRLRPAGWTSADAAGLPILPGLVRWSEVAAGRIDHALRFTVERTRRAYVWPARHSGAT